MDAKRGLTSIWRHIFPLFLIAMLGVGIFGCAKPTAPKALLPESGATTSRLVGRVEEVSPPEVLQTLKQVIDAYEPQVRILSPRPGEVLEDTSVSVRFQVRGLPIFKNEQWQLGPHLHVFLDDEPYRAVYDLSEPLVLTDLAPGTHTLRVFASRPWHESFKNQGAFDQRTFHVFAQTPQKALNKNQPLLTYSRPQGDYGAEPIMLDFYLVNAPLHLIAQEDSQDAIADWRIRCTINGQSFVFDQWQPIYLKGFKPGQNWIQLELIDENGDLIDNAFNNTVRVINYEPGGEDTLSKLMRGELSLQQVAGILDPTYVPPIEPAPEPEVPTEAVPPEAVGEEATEETMIEGTIEKAVETPVEEPAKEPTKEPIEESIEEPLEQSVEAPVEESVMEESFMEKSVEAPIDGREEPVEEAPKVEIPAIAPAESGGPSAGPVEAPFEASEGVPEEAPGVPEVEAAPIELPAQAPSAQESPAPVEAPVEATAEPEEVVPSGASWLGDEPEPSSPSDAPVALPEEVPFPTTEGIEPLREEEAVQPEEIPAIAAPEAIPDVSSSTPPAPSIQDRLGQFKQWLKQRQQSQSPAPAMAPETPPMSPPMEEVQPSQPLETSPAESPGPDEPTDENSKDADIVPAIEGQPLI